MLIVIIKNCKIALFLLIVIFLALLLLLDLKYKNKMEIYGLIHDNMSFSVFYALNNKKELEAKKILASNLSNVVLHYDKKIFSESKSLGRLCIQWNQGMKEIVLSNIHEKDFNKTLYQKNILKKIKLINIDCERVSSFQSDKRGQSLL